MFYPLRFSKFTFSDYTCLLSLQVLRISRVYPATLCDLSSIQEEFTSAKSRRSLLFKHLLISGFPSFTMFVFHDNATTEWTNYNATMKKPWNTNLWNFDEKLQTGSSSIETFYATNQSTPSSPLNYLPQRTNCSRRVNAWTNVTTINIQTLFAYLSPPSTLSTRGLISIHRWITVTWRSIALFQTPITPEIRRGGWPGRYLWVSRWYDSHGIRDQARERTAKARVAVPEYVIIIGKLGLPSDTHAHIYTCVNTYVYVCVHRCRNIYVHVGERSRVGRLGSASHARHARGGRGNREEYFYCSTSCLRVAFPGHWADRLRTEVDIYAWTNLLPSCMPVPFVEHVWPFVWLLDRQFFEHFQTAVQVWRTGRRYRIEDFWFWR